MATELELQLSKHELAPNTVANALRMLSTFYSDLVEEGRATVNPVRMLPKKTRKLVRRANVDERFVDKLANVVRIIGTLNASAPQVAVAYAVGALAGLRTGEIIGLEWKDVDLARKVLHVRRQVRHGKVGPLKDGDEREVGIQDSLLPILVAWKLKSGGQGQLFRPEVATRGGTAKTPAKHVAGTTFTKHFHKALRALKLVEKDDEGGETLLTWYQATRHTFASHYMMAGGDIAKLQAEMGHSDIQTTQRYAKLSPDFRTEKDRNLIRLPKIAGSKVIPFSDGIGSKTVASSKKKQKQFNASA